MFHFGIGGLFATPFGSFASANPTPMQFGTIQDASIDIQGTLKELYGRNAFPDDARRAQVKITGKAKYARIHAKMFNDLFFGQMSTRVATGQSIAIVDEAGVVTTNTVTVSQSALFSEDLGVIYASDGTRLTKVASGPTAGQYSVSSGVYTFAAGDNGKTVAISYTYTAASGGYTYTVKNQAMGLEPSFILNLAEKDPTTGNVMKLKLFACKASKLSLAVKNDDYVIPDMDFTAFADSGGNVMKFDMSEE